MASVYGNDSTYRSRYKRLEKEFNELSERYELILDSYNHAIKVLKTMEAQIKELNSENDKLSRKIFGLETTIEHYKEKEDHIYENLALSNTKRRR